MYIFYTRFLNTMKQEPVMEQLLPLSDERLKTGEGPTGQRGLWDYIYEPEAQPVIDDIMVRYVEALIYQALTENMASEQSARMVAMKAASDNAGNVINELTLDLQQIPPGCHYQGIVRDRRWRGSSLIFRSSNLRNNMNQGKIVQCIGAVVDVEFAREEMPKVYDALVLEGTELTLEVQQQLGDGIVRTIALGSSDGLRRGMMVTNTRNQIQVPVGTKTLGRIMDVLGRPIDEMGDVGAGKNHVDSSQSARV